MSPKTCDLSWVKQGGLDHSIDISEKDHGKFKVEFQNFKEKTGFEEEVAIWKLKYYVQMAFLHGWKAGIDIDKK